MISTNRTTAYKVHGAGNDFVALIGGPGDDALLESIARTVCDRHRGIGGDGLLWLDTSSMPTLARAKVWNPDGSPVGMCLNAARCAFALLRQLFGVSSIDIHFPAMIINASAAPDGVRLLFSLGLNHGSDDAGKAIGPEVWFVGLADPHVIVDWTKMGAISSAALQGIATTHSDGGGLSTRAANCHLVARTADPFCHSIRSFERRVEAETQACGSGCVAAYLALGLSGEHTFETLSRDGIRVSRSGKLWSLEGPASIVFQTQIDLFGPVAMEKCVHPGVLVD